MSIEDLHRNKFGAQPEQGPNGMLEGLAIGAAVTFLAVCLSGNPESAPAQTPQQPGVVVETSTPPPTFPSVTPR